MTAPAGLVELMNECWRQQPQHRPNFDTICRRLSHIASDAGLHVRVSHKTGEREQPLVDERFLVVELDDVNSALAGAKASALDVASPHEVNRLVNCHVTAVTVRRRRCIVFFHRRKRDGENMVHWVLVNVS